MGHRFESVQQVRDGLKDVDYLADEGIAGVVYLADRLGKPVLVEGPAGTGKTQLAKSVAEMTGARLIRLQCYEGLDESKALYEWNYKKQLLRIQADRNSDALERGRGRHLLRGVPAHPPAARGDPRRRAGRAADRRGRPRRGRDRGAAARDPLRLPGVDPRARHDRRPSRSRSCSSRRTTPVSCREALKRRCLYLHIDYPDLEREKEIVLTKVPERHRQPRRPDRPHRALDPPARAEEGAVGVARRIDWARTLVLLGIDDIDAQQAKETLHILLKYQTDIAKAAKELSASTSSRPARMPRVTDARPARRVRHELRNAGLPVSLTENLDAMEAVQHIPIEDREAFKYALGATLVKNNAHWRAFETVFEVYFSLRGPEYSIVDGDDATSTRCGARCKSRCARARARAPAAADGVADARGAGRDAAPGADERRRGA